MESVWSYGISAFLFLAFASFLPVLFALVKKVKLNPRGDHFSESPHFSDLNKILLEQHYSRLEGTLIFWKNKAERHRRFHYYTLCWTILISILIRIITQTIDSSEEAKLFLTIISSHTALLWGFHRALNIGTTLRLSETVNPNFMIYTGDCWIVQKVLVIQNWSKLKAILKKLRGFASLYD